ncbi:MAG: glycosyltransferase family 9 protein [Planctomycetes bacterium]|nr:glycosyltransferase family 9 protein [Planctomycetota bacterium]
MLHELVRHAKHLVRQLLDWSVSPSLARLLGEPFFSLLGLRQGVKTTDITRVKRLLVVRLDEIGDVVMTTPFLRELRRNLPKAWITVIVKPSVWNLMELCPHVDEVLTYDWSTHGRLWQVRRHWRASRLIWGRLWRRRFDLAIVPRWDADRYHGAFLAYFAGVPWRVGYAERGPGRKPGPYGGSDALFTHLVPGSNLKHEVEHNLDIIRFMGGMVEEQRLELWVGQDDEAFAETVLAQYAVRPGESVIGLGPSSGNSYLKQWPLSNFIDLALWLRTEYGHRILVIGAVGEEALGWEIQRTLGSSAINVVGKTTLRQMAALLKRCCLYVGNDAGPMHVAAAMGTPVLALFGPSCHHRFRPWGDEHRVMWPAPACGPCVTAQHVSRCSRCNFDQPQCMIAITVEQVKEAVAAQLQAQRSRKELKRMHGNAGRSLAPHDHSFPL